MRVNDSMVGANRDALSGSVYQRSLGDSECVDHTSFIVKNAYFRPALERDFQAIMVAHNVLS